MLYALTINPGHDLFDLLIDDVIDNIIITFKTNFIEIVSHNEDHYHALIEQNEIIVKDKDLGKLCHCDIVRNLKAYQKYMHNHDVTQSRIIGELPYYEDDSIIDYLILQGPSKTVIKFGWKVLKNYSNLVKFYNEYQLNKKGGANNV